MSESKFNGPDRQVIKIEMDGVGRSYFSPRPETITRAERFQEKQRQLLAGKISFSDPWPCVAAYLVMFEGVAVQDSLQAALMAVPEAYTWNGNACLEWQDRSGRTDRRILSCLLHDNVPAQHSSIGRSEAKAAIAFAASVLYPGSRDPVRLMLGDAQSWLLLHLPGVLFAHVVGTNPLSALSKGTLVREETRLPMKSEQNHADAERGAGLGIALEAFHDADGREGDASLVDRIIAICKRNRKLTEHADKRRMLMGLLDLASEAQLSRTHETSSLILAWAIDLVESGTSLKPDIHPGTIEDYVRLAAPALRMAFMGKRVEEILPHDFERAYESILDATSVGQKRVIHAAITSWHLFLMKWLGVPARQIVVGEALPEAIPRANVIWSHEVDQIFHWLECADGDERLLGQLRVSFAIATQVRIRASELFKLRLRNIRTIHEVLHIEICPMLRDGRLKSPSARRTMAIKDVTACRIIDAWAIRRRLEGALGEDLLFGDPHNAEKVFRLGSFYVAINQIIKAATGDREASFHTLSHSWISSAIRDCLLQPDQRADIDCLDRISVMAGHRSVQTSLDNYFHRYEEALRLHLDKAIMKIPLTSKEAERLSGISAAALRKRSSDRNQDSQSTYWMAIMSRDLRLTLPAVSEGWVAGEPSLPGVLSPRPELKYSTVLHALSDISSGYDLDAVGVRSSMGTNWVRKHLMNATMSVLRDLPQSHLGGVRLDRHMSPEKAASSLASLSRSDKTSVSFHRAWQGKYDSLRSFLDRQNENATVASVLHAWRRCFSGRFMSFVHADDAGELIAFLRNAGVPLENLAVCHSSSTDGDLDGMQMILRSEIDLHFSREYRMVPRVFATRSRRGRPNCYLIWSGHPIPRDKMFAKAAVSLIGFNALMLAALVFIELVEKGKPSGHVVAEYVEEGCHG